MIIECKEAKTTMVKRVTMAKKMIWVRKTTRKADLTPTHDKTWVKVTTVRKVKMKA